VVSAAPHPDVERSRTSGRRLLFVDDDADLRELIRDVVAALGIERCVLAGSLAEVEQQRHAALDCSLAVLDINLGWGAPTGVEVYEWLKRGGFGGKVVFLTGHGVDDPRVQEVARHGALRILLKPIGLEILSSLVTADSAPDASP
jgi:DNA-binding NtrC family response regulator